MNTIKQDSSKINPTAENSIKLNFPELDSLELDTTMLDSIRLDSLELDTTMSDSIRLDSLKLDTTMLDSIRLDSLKLETAKQNAIYQKKRKQDSIMARTSYRPTGLRIGTDLVSWIRSLLPDGFVGWGIHGDVDFNRYYLSGEFGRWERTVSSTTQDYRNDGYYFLIGADVAFFSKHRDKNMFFAGMRYGHSTFNEHLEYTIEDEIFGPLNKTVSNTVAISDWIELTAGFRMQLWKDLWMGYTLKLKLEPNVRNANQLQSYDIPGFGSVSRMPNWGFNYQLFWRIRFHR